MSNLYELLNKLITRMLATSLNVTEGRVLTIGPPPYRRLDCDGRALAYLRMREHKAVLRIDVSGLWLADRPTRLRSPTGMGAATLLVREESDLDEAVAFLTATVEHTRTLGPRHALGSVGG